VPAEWRRLALERLRGWDEPLKREGVWGDWVDLPARSTDDARRAVLGSLDAIVAAAKSDAELLELAEAVGAKYRLEIDLDSALAVLTDASKGESLRIVTLEQLASLEPGATVDACRAVLEAAGDVTTPGLRMRARQILAGADSAAGAEAYAAALEKGELGEKQDAVRRISMLDSGAARERVDQLAAQLGSGELDAAIALEVFEAASNGRMSDPSVAERIVSWEPERPAGFQTALLALGGDVARGRDVFLHHEAAQCARCHTVRGEEAVGIAGPDLTAVGARTDRAVLVQSLVEPNAAVTPGFGTVSAMPPMSALLTPRQTRDVVAYLASLTDGAPAADGVLRATVGELAGINESGSEPGGDGTASGKKRVGTMLLPAAAYIVVLVPIGLWLIIRLRRKPAG